MDQENIQNNPAPESPEEENPPKTSPPFPLPDIIMLLLINSGVDILELGVDLISPVPVIGQIILFLEPGVDIVCLVITRLWFLARRAKSGLMMAGQSVELLPLADILPIRTLTLILAIIIANRASASSPAKPVLSLLKK